MERGGVASSRWRRLRSGDRIAHLVTLVFASGILLITVALVCELYSS